MFPNFLNTPSICTRKEKKVNVGVHIGEVTWETAHHCIIEYYVSYFENVMSMKAVLMSLSGNIWECTFPSMNGSSRYTAAYVEWKTHTTFKYMYVCDGQLHECILSYTKGL